MRSSPTEYSLWAEQIRRLAVALEAVAAEARCLGVPRPTESAWFQLLHQKLLPQLDAPPSLIVAVVGGTNTGKSAIFNCLAGEQASRASPLAAGTKHPVCLVPSSLADPTLLGRLFADFELRAWHSPDDPLQACEPDLLFWRIGREVPERLLLLDTPDVDSDAQVNWRRAGIIRQSADVLVAVLTQQKYNDAAVKQFFRSAAAADKPVIVVFNQVDLTEDRGYWPVWLATFTDETQADVLRVYAVGHDRAAAQRGELVFHEIARSPQQSDHPFGPSSGEPHQQADLRGELSSLHFDTIKLRTLRGAAAEVLNAQHGAARYLSQVEAASREFATAAKSLGGRNLVDTSWPAVPTPLVIEQIHHWWEARRPPWARMIHRGYRTVGNLVLSLPRGAWHAMRGAPADPLVEYQRKEREALILAITQLWDRLDQLAKVGNEVLAPRLQKLLGGAARERLIDEALAAHATLPAVGEEFPQMVADRLDRWQSEYPRMSSLLRTLDQVGAAARPVVSLVLVVSGGFLVAEAAGQVAAHALTNVAGEAATAAASGEVVAQVGSQGLGQAAAKLLDNLQREYAQSRQSWLANWIERRWLGELLAELRSGEAVATSAAVVEARQTLQALLD